MTIEQHTHEEWSRMIDEFTPTFQPKGAVSDVAHGKAPPTLNSLVESISQLARANRGSTIMKDGVLCCEKCGAPVEAWVKGPKDENGEKRLVLMPVRCDCAKEEERRYKERKAQADFERELRDMRRTIGMGSCSNTFEQDDKRFPKISDVCKKYVEKWDQVYESNMGILLYGDKGLGKSFFAECIVNALAEKRILTGFVTTAELIMRFQGTNDKDELLDSLTRFQLLALDDLGTERTTSFGAETMYNIINARYRVRKPTIITSNLDLNELKQEQDMLRGRIYDRIIEMCPIAIPMTGESRRMGLFEANRKDSRDMMRDNDSEEGA